MISLPVRYAKILQTLHGGGMSDTLVCHDDNLQRSVVVKSLKSGIAAQRLLDELKALSAIRSDFVVQVYDVIKDPTGDVVGFVEEHLTGPDLTECVPGCSAHDATKVLYPVAAGITEIHAHGVIHRDIKPENMKQNSSGQLKIFDFGLAKDNTNPGTTSLYFSPGYTAPEAFSAAPHGVHTFSPALDVFAFGCVCIWLLNQKVLPAELFQVPPRLPIPGFTFSALSVAVPPSIASLLDRCIDPNPSARPSMIEIKSALAAEILRDRHRLLLTLGGKEYYVDVTKRSINLKWQGSSVDISYTGTEFVITSTTGTVMINNGPASAGQKLSGSSIVVLGVDDKTNGLTRASITCDVSHPEVTL
jgi:eukaryotic-like serine/threonine-protein kinase